MPERPAFKKDFPTHESTFDRYDTTKEQLVDVPDPIEHSVTDESVLPNEQPIVMDSSNSPVQSNEFSFSWIMFMTWIWFFGCVYFLIQMFYQNWKFQKRLRQEESVHLSCAKNLLKQQAEYIGIQRIPNLLESDAVTTPAVHRLVKPMIILPRGMTESLSEEQLRHVFLHELAHIKRWDLLIHWVAHILRAIHWFNPIIWFAVARMRVDCEMATDSLALKHIGEVHRQAYGETILDLVKRVHENSRLPGLVGIVEGKKEMKRRLISIRNFRGRPGFSMVAIATILLLSIVSLTKAVPKPDVSLNGPEIRDQQNTPIPDEAADVDAIICTVVDSERIPVPDVLVSFGVKRMSLFTPIGKTDVNGRIEIPVKSFKPDLVLNATGFAPTLLTFSLDSSLTNRTYQLEKAGKITGRVIDAEKNPVEGAEVIPSDWFGFQKLVDRMIPEQRIITDTEGRFTWEEAPNHGRIAWTVFAKDLKAIRDQMEPVGDELIFQMAKPDQVIGTVVDAETGEAIPEFKFSVGDQRRISSPVMNLYHKGEGADGAFTVDILEPSDDYHVVTVTADGYALAQSPVFKDGDGMLRFRFELQKADDIEFKVLQPDGQPASGATMVQRLEKSYDVWMTTPYTIDLNRILGEARIRTTDDAGHGGTTPLHGMTGLVVVHEQGFAEIDLDTLRSISELQLSPWGRIEGKIFNGGMPLQGQKIRVERNRWDSAFVVQKTTTLSDGSFVFEGLPAGEYKVTRDHGTNLAVTDVVAGETTTLTVGKTGRTLVGKATVDMPSIDEVYWQQEDYFLISDLPVPADIKHPTEEEQRKGVEGMEQFQKRKQGFWDSAEGKAIKQMERSYAIRFDHDGSFRIEGVVPGRYILELQLKKRHRESPNTTLINSIATARQTVVVPEEGVSSLERVIDLGEIELLPVEDNNRLTDNSASRDLPKRLRGEAFEIDIQFTYKFGQRHREVPITLFIQGENIRMDWVWPNVRQTMSVINQDVYILQRPLDEDKDGKEAHFAFISNVDAFPKGEAIGEAMYLIFNLGKLNENQRIARLSKSFAAKNPPFTVSHLNLKKATKGGLKKLTVYGKELENNGNIFNRLFGNKEYPFMQTDFILKDALSELTDLEGKVVMFQTYHVPSGFSRTGKVNESFQFQFQKVEKVAISAENSILPSLKSVDKLTVSDSRFRDQISKESIVYTVQDGIWPKRDAEIVNQTLERELMFEKYRKRSNEN